MGRTIGNSIERLFFADGYSRMESGATQYRITEADRQAARMLLTAHASPIDKPRFRRGIFGWVMFIGLAVMLIILLQPKHDQSPQIAPPTVVNQNDSGNGMMIYFLGVVLFFVSFFGLIKAGRNSDKVADFFQISDSGINFIWKSHVRTFHPWSQYKGVVQNDTVIVLLTKPNNGIIVPLRELAADSIVQIHRAIYQAFPPK